MVRLPRSYYVSLSGNDANDGTAPTRAKRTVAAGVSLLRHMTADSLNLERGGVWHESLGQWKLSGAGLNADSCMRVRAYGVGERPLLLTGQQDGVWTSGSGGAPATTENVVFQGLSFRADGYLGGGDQMGARFQQASRHIVFEDCRFDRYAICVDVEGFPEGVRHHDFLLRGCELLNAWASAPGKHSQGLYAYAVDTLTIDRCLVANCGSPNIFSHGIYIQNGCTGVTVRESEIRDSGSHGLQLRCGGEVLNNLFTRNPIACSIGGGNFPDLGGVRCQVRNNRILDGRDIDPTLPRGWGLWFANIFSGDVVGNTIACNRDGQQPVAIILDGAHKGDTRASIGVNRLRFNLNTVYDWEGGVLEQGNVVGVELGGWIGKAPPVAKVG